MVPSRKPEPGSPPDATLIREHGPRVFAMCARLAADPEDCYQEIWEKVLSALDRFDPQGPATLGTWIATIARRHLIDAHRRRQVRGEVLSIAQLPASEPAADEQVAQIQRRERIEAAVARLPDAQRRVVVLHHIHGVPLEQLAEEEGVPIGTLKSRLHRGRTQLAELLGGEP
jgi:RNA polymerase sigma-70 factor (ECF subfamily)